MPPATNTCTKPSPEPARALPLRCLRVEGSRQTLSSTVQLAPAPSQARRVPAAARVAAGTLRLWHLLSLDAPTVAALWTWFLAAANHIRLPLTAPLAMAIAVWTLYAADRLLDARLLASHPAAGHRRSQRLRTTASLYLQGDPALQGDLAQELEARHLFHHRHRRSFRTGMVVCSLALALLLPRLSPASLRLYLMLSGLLLAYLVLIHTPRAGLLLSQAVDLPHPLPHPLPKELAVGVFFSAATFIPTIAREPALRPILLSAALLFALLCSLNCLFIYAWEHPVPTPRTHPATRLALRFLRHLTLAAVLTGLVLAFSATLPAAVRSSSALLPTLHTHLPPWPIPAAAALSAVLLLLLDGFNRSRYRPARTTLRAAADLCLLTPLLVLPFLRG
jgi:hypothetical protein